MYKLKTKLKQGVNWGIKEQNHNKLINMMRKRKNRKRRNAKLVVDKEDLYTFKNNYNGEK